MLMLLGFFLRALCLTAFLCGSVDAGNLKESVNVTFPAGHYFSIGSAKCQHQQRQLPHPPRKLLGYLCLKAMLMYFCRVPPIY